MSHAGQRAIVDELRIRLLPTAPQASRPGICITIRILVCRDKFTTVYHPIKLSVTSES